MLKIENVSVCFGTCENSPVVDSVSMDIVKNSKNVIIGETGSGKSVLLLAVLKMLPTSAIVKGRAVFEGENLMSMSSKELEKIRGARISYIPQGSGNGMNPLLTVGFQIGEPLMEHKGFKKKSAFAESIKLLKKFSVGNEENNAKAYPHTYSGGMRQRALIAMGVSAGADVIFADEPTKGLDNNRIDTVIECFRQLDDKTLLCVTHDLRFAKEIGENISVMYAAQQIEYCSKEEFFAKPLHPYSEAMINAMPENGLKSSVGFAPSHEAYETEGCRFSYRCPYFMERCKLSPPLINNSGRKVRCWKYAD
nr:ABC transporter ATP-binding protein [Sedimentibacter sp.]